MPLASGSTPHAEQIPFLHCTLKTIGAVLAIAGALQPLAGSLRSALVFGSVAKGIDHASTDVDVLLVSSCLQLSDALALLLPLEERLGRRIQVKLYRPGEFSAHREEAGSVAQRIVAGPIELLHGSLE